MLHRAISYDWKKIGVIELQDVGSWDKSGSNGGIEDAEIDAGEYLFDEFWFWECFLISEGKVFELSKKLYFDFGIFSSH